ncbi:MAG TPA: 2-C-methyl-D-erythritol 4-phosphate cytidylyltransferase [Mycobacteriales bacterium]|nr:2-C-methyl-D-erythritol 4-phosphate cytidylyltransferase [Mycobacteriales bacterium]
MDVAGLVLATDPECGPPGSCLDALCALDGVPLIVHAVRALQHSGAVDVVTVAAPNGAEGRVRRTLERHLSGQHVAVVDGHGPAALARACGAAEAVVLSEFRRPLAPPELVCRVVDAVRSGADVAVPVVAVTETVKALDPGGWVVRTLARETLGQVQSPWALRTRFVAGVVAELTAGAGRTVWDGADRWTGPLAGAGLAGVGVVAVAGHPDAFAVRSPVDLDVAAAVLRARRRHHGDPAAVGWTG